MPDAAEEEWCERRLLARIHRYTVKRLRAEIEPVAARDFMRFLLRVAARHDARRAWKVPRPSMRSSGNWKGSRRRPARGKREILPARLAHYDPAWLDDQCLAGRVAWARLRPRNGKAQRQGATAGAGQVHANYPAAAPSRAALDSHLDDGVEPMPLTAGGQAVADYHPREWRVIFR